MMSSQVDNNHTTESGSKTLKKNYALICCLCSGGPKV